MKVIKILKMKKMDFKRDSKMEDSEGHKDYKKKGVDIWTKM